MSNILDYLKWRGDLSFNQSPLNEVDNLILSKLSYLDFTDLANGPMTLKDVSKLYLESKGYGKIGMLLDKNFPILLEQAGQSSRFGSIIVSNIVDKTCEEAVIQFAAMTFKIDDVLFIAYRGTDDSLVGWKEDFMMSIMDTVPAQVEALKYLNDLASRYPDKSLYIGGHSKGGNLAVYSAVHTTSEVKNRIVQVFNNDGPGFKSTLINTDDYKVIASRIKTLVPKSSIVGMLLEHEESYDVVQCTIKQSGLLQHDGFTWEVLGSSFIHLEDVDRESKFFNQTIKNVLNNMSIEQRESFTYAFFDILTANNQKSLLDIQSGHIKSLYAMLKAREGLDKVTRKALNDVYKQLFAEGFRQLTSREAPNE